MYRKTVVITRKVLSQIFELEGEARAFLTDEGYEYADILADDE